MGTEAGVHPSTVANWLRRYGLVPTYADRFAPKGAPNRDTLERLAEAGCTLAEIGAQLDRSISTVRHWLHKWKIDRPKRKIIDMATAPQLVMTMPPPRSHGVAARGTWLLSLPQVPSERVSDWRRRVKRKLVEEAGGRCKLCGYDACDAALRFHHLDPTQKSFALSAEGVARNLGLARAEAAKCVLLCANCHAEVESNYRELDEVTGNLYSPGWIRTTET